jgi:hypothetical protein
MFSPSKFEFRKQTKGKSEENADQL